MSRNHTVRLELCRFQRYCRMTEVLGLLEKHQAFQVEECSSRLVYVLTDRVLCRETQVPPYSPALEVGMVWFSNCTTVSCWEKGEILTTSVLVVFNLK